MNLQPTDIYNIQEKRPKTSDNIWCSPTEITQQQQIQMHYSQLETEDLNSETLATYFQELNFNIIEYCEEKYPVQSKYSFNFKSETETSNKDKQKVKQYSRTTPNTSILPKTTAKHLQTPEQRTSVKLPLFITLFPISFVQPQTPSLPLNRFSRPKDFQSPRNPIQKQEAISTSANIINYLQENESNYSESLESEETESEPEEITRNKEKMATAYIAKIPEFTGEDNKPVLKNGLTKFKKQEMQMILDQFIAGLKDKLIKKVYPHALADLVTAIKHAKNYEMAMEEANHTKLVNLAIGETSSVAEEKIDQLTKKTTKSKHYLTIPEELNFQQPAFSEDIFSFEFEANKSPFLLSNAAANEQKAITAMYTKAILQRTVDRPAQTVIVITDSIKKTPIGEINNFLFTIDRITIPVKVLVMDTPQYQALVGNDWLLKANANLDWKTQKLKILYQGQYTIVPAICGTFNKQSEKAPVFEFKEKKEMPLTKTYMALGSTSNWAEETEQGIFEELRGWKKVRYFTPEPQKQPLYILLKYKDCNKKLSSIRACIFPEEKYETRTCYFCKACHREQFRSPKRSEK
ncbi:hypothetical protein G9A89_004780 [Geosiphon pyriformis]|nr:hypothetical protein G9A89_004780 [Geosiphon pyriformis]